MISALVLAAGEGRRLGGPKALVELRGRTLLDRVLETLASSTVDEIVVACGADADAVEAAAGAAAARWPDTPVRVVRHEGWAAGRTSTVQAAWRSCPEAAHALIVPVDHPLVRVVTLDTMLGVHGYASGDVDIIVPVVEVTGGGAEVTDGGAEVTDGGAPKRRRGHPVLLSARLRAQVLALGPDQPLHDIVRSHVPLEVPVDDEGILVDIDTPDDLARAARQVT